jgi:outer membrane protein TolC
MRIFLSFFCVLYLTGFSNAQNLLTLDEAVNIALQRNPDLQRSTNSISSFESNVKASYGGLLPSIGADGDFSWQRSEQAGGTRLISGVPFPYPSSTTEERIYSAAVGYNWTLLTASQIMLLFPQSKNNLEAARLSLAKIKT